MVHFEGFIHFMFWPWFDPWNLLKDGEFMSFMDKKVIVGLVLVIKEHVRNNSFSKVGCAFQFGDRRYFTPLIPIDITINVKSEYMDSDIENVCDGNEFLIIGVNTEGVLTLKEGDEFLPGVEFDLPCLDTNPDSLLIGKGDLVLVVVVIVVLDVVID